MPAKAGIQWFKIANKIKTWIPAFAGMTALFLDCATVSKAGIQLIYNLLDPGFRRGDNQRDFLPVHKSCSTSI